MYQANRTENLQMDLTPGLQMESYKASKVNTAVLQLVNRVKQGAFSGNDKVELSSVTDDVAMDIEKLTGINVKGYKVVFEARQIQHILNDHGENGATDRSMSNPEDIAKIEYTLNDPDDVRLSGKTQAYVSNINGKMKPADTVLYEKELGEGSYYVVQAVPDTKKKTLYIVTAFKGKSGYKKMEASQSTNANNLGATSETESVDTSSSIIFQNENAVKAGIGDVRLLNLQVNATPEMMDQMRRLSAVTGRRIILYTEFAAGKDVKDGYYDRVNKVLYVNTEGQNPAATTVSHELTHSIEPTAEWFALRDLVFKRIEETTNDLEKQRQDIKSLYARNNIELVSEDSSDPLRAVDSEVIAAYVAKHLLKDAQSIEDAVRQKPTLGQKIRNWLDSLLAKLGNQNAQEAVFLREARDLWASAIKKTQSSFTAETAKATPAQTGQSTQRTANDLLGMDTEQARAWAHENYAKGNISEQKLNQILEDIEVQEDEADYHISPEAELHRLGMTEGQYSISPIKGQAGDYGIGVLLDTDLFDGASPRNWGKVLGDFVYNNLAGKELLVYDDAGNEETIHLAKTTDRVRKDGAKNSHKVIDKIARYRGDNIKALATVHLSELLQTSKYENATNDNTHQWMDENGWEHRKTYIQDTKGNIYEATLNIARGMERNILYEINNIRLVDKAQNKRAAHGAVPSTGNGRGSHIKSSSSADMIADAGSDVKQYSISESTVDKADVISSLRSILDNGGDPAALRQYVASLEQNAGKTERNNANAYHNNNFAERNSGYAYQAEDTAEQILEAAHSQGVSVEEYLEMNWERFDVDGQWNENARQALKLEESAGLGGRQFSISMPVDDEQNNVYTKIGLDDIKDVIKKRIGIKWNYGNVIKLDQAEYAAVTSRISTEYNRRGTHGGVQYVERSTDGKDAKFYLYLFVDHGFDNYEIIARLDYAKQDGLIQEIRRMVQNGQVAEGTDRGVSRLRSLYGSIDGSNFSNHNRGVGETDDKKVAGRSRQQWERDNGLSGPADFNRFDERGDSSRRVKEQYSELGAKGLGKQYSISETEGVEESATEPAAEETVEGLSLPTLEETDAGTDADVRSTLPRKAQRYLKGAERTLLNNLCKSLGVPWYARRSYLQPMVEEISNEYLRSGTVSEEMIDRIFETAYEEGVVVDREFYDQYVDLKKFMQKNPVTLHESNRADIADFDDFKKRNRWNVRIVNEGGLPVDSAYRELREMAPELFPEDITHPADQLVRMADVSSSIRIAEKSLEEYYKHDPDFRKWAKNDFAASVCETTKKTSIWMSFLLWLAFNGQLYY